MKLKELYQNNKLIQFINETTPLNAAWLNSTENPVADIVELDNYILMCLGESKLLKSVENTAINNIRTIINTNQYRLDKLWQSVNFDYNPIDNYDRTETQTHNEKIETDDHVVQSSNGARTQTNNNGTYTDTNTNDDSTTAFDSADYGKATNKNVSTFVKGASTDTITQNASVDTVTQNGYTDNTSGGYILRARGNIGTMSTQNMIEQERKIVNYNFYDEIVKLLEKYITAMVYDFD